MVLPALPMVSSPEGDHSMGKGVSSVIRTVSSPGIIMTPAASTTHLVGSQKRKARKQCITRLDPENIHTSRGKLNIWL
jgi:hypothetical protein